MYFLTEKSNSWFCCWECGELLVAHAYILTCFDRFYLLLRTNSPIAVLLSKLLVAALCSKLFCVFVSFLVRTVLSHLNLNFLLFLGYVTQAISDCFVSW